MCFSRKEDSFAIFPNLFRFEHRSHRILAISIKNEHAIAPSANKSNKTSRGGPQRMLLDVVHSLQEQAFQKEKHPQQKKPIIQQSMETLLEKKKCKDGMDRVCGDRMLPQRNLCSDA